MSKKEPKMQVCKKSEINQCTQKCSVPIEQGGKRLIKVDKYYPSSKRCSNCGNIKKGLK